MKITNQLSIATLVLAGVFATGCSQQQSAGGSQVAGGSQQSAGGSQVAGGSQQSAGGSQVSGSQQAGSQQQVEEPPVMDKAVVVPPAKPPTTTPVTTPVRTPNRWAHSHPAQPRCTKSVTHTHKYNNAAHRHTYSCSRPATTKPAVDVFALQRKLKAKGYYKGPIDGVVGPGTRSALQRFMQR